MADFLVDCLAKHSCDNTPRFPFDGNSGDKQYEGYSFAPFIEFKFAVGGEILTVGNNSRPGGDNTAVIVSMEYGMSEGEGVELEIFDEEGGNFTKSMQGLNKTLNSISDDFKNFELDFGWLVEKKCGGESPQKFSVFTTTSTKVYLMPIEADVNYEGGKIKYRLKCTDQTQRISEVRQECNIGTEDKKVSLKEAIRKLMKDRLPPPVMDVKFYKAGSEEEWNFKNSDGGKDGPKSVWGTCQQNKLATIRRWINPFTTADGKGIVLEYEGSDRGKPPPKEGGTLILREDPSTNSGGCNSNVATYIVNGGELSPVLSFNPSVIWTFSSNSSSGGSTAGASGASEKAGKTCEDKNDKAGTASKMSTGGQDNSRSFDQQAAATATSVGAHEKAAASREIMGGITAELKIIGDPKYVIPSQWKTKYVSLIVINPFHLRSQNLFLLSAGSCPEWLSKPACNPVFSNKNWHIMGVNHQIKGGSYVTILKLLLDVPNIEIPRNAKLGNDPNGFDPEIKPPENCGKCEK